ncbi:MAG: hypothetical protein IJ365_07540, partial [Clostridia bacterium]|nr:hypothetical protein [Clostridia bacterium]
MVIKIFKKTRRIICICLAIPMGIFGGLSAYSCSRLPDTMYVTEGDELNFDSYGPMSRFFTVDAAAGGSGELTRSGAVHSSGSTVTVSFLGLDVKNVNVNVIASDYIVPCGNTVGIKIYAGGLMVLRIASFEAADGSQARP